MTTAAGKRGLQRNTITTPDLYQRAGVIHGRL